MQDALAKCGARDVESTSTKVSNGWQLLDRDLFLGHLLNGLEHPVLAWFCQRDGHAFAARTPDATHAMNIGVDRGGNIEVNNVGEVVNVKTTSSDVGCNK